MELLNLAPLHLPHVNCRKASYIHIARDDLQRRDLFKPAQYLRSHLDQLPRLALYRYRRENVLWYRDVGSIPADQ